MTGLTGRIRTTVRVAVEAARNPALRRAELAFLTFNTVEYGSWVAILIYAYGATGPASVGIVALAQLLPAAVVAPLAGTRGDRYPRERVLLAAYVLLTVFTAMTAAGMLLGLNPLAVYLAAILAAMSLTLVRPTQNALLPSLARTPEELTAANAVSSIAEAGGLLMGPLSAAVILSFSTPGAVTALLAGTAAVGAALVLGLRPDRAAAPRTPDADPGQVDAARERAIVAGFRALAHDADARLVVTILAARTLLIGVTDVLFVILAIDLFGTGESGAALLSAALGAGGIIGGAAAFMLVGQRPIAPVLLACAAAWGLAFGIMGIVGSGTLAPLLLIAGGTGLTVMDVAGRTILQRGVRDDVLARVFGILEGLMMAALAVGSILVPLVIAVTGLGGAVIVFALLLPAIVLLTWPGLQALDRRSTVPRREIAILRRLRLFEALDPPAMETLGRAATWITMQPGTAIIREGVSGDCFYALETGAVTVSRGGSPIRTLTPEGDG
ncbi:MAG: MFS transporter, partial [Chloroflexi bacterium]|nr:MFS transporter [Chloroflexota bacterium]